MRARYVCSIGLKSHFDCVSTFTYCETDTINVDVVQAVRVTRKFRIFVQQEVEDLTLRFLTRQQIVIVEIDFEIGCVKITVEIVGVIHGHGDFGRITGRTTSGQCRQVLNRQVAIGVVGTNFVVTVDVLGINNDVVVTKRSITRLNINLFDICNTRLNISSVCK